MLTYTLASRSAFGSNRLAVDRAFITQNRQMDEFLRRHGITPLVLTYEVEQPSPSVDTMLTFLNIPTKIQNVSVSVRKTRSALSEAIRAMYLRDFTAA
jgi:hypothetical protein